LTQADRPEAHLGLARYYYFGLGGSNDLERAFEHVWRCDLGANPQAALMAAEMYFVGAGTGRDLAAARLLFTDLANAGYPAGFLGLMRLEKTEGYRLRSLLAFFKGLFLTAKLAANDKDDDRLVGIGGRRGNFRADAFVPTHEH
jgi:TPR repeat protein